MNDEVLSFIRGLWPAFHEESSNYHVALIAILVHTKRRENLSTWGISNSRTLQPVLILIIRCRRFHGQA